MNLRGLASYPFLKEAAALVKEKGPGLDDLLRDIAFAEVRAAGVGRVQAALESGELPDPSCRGEVECLGELLSYICARFVVSSAQSPPLTRRYALAEAKLAGRLLEQEPLEEVLAVASELGVRAEPREGGAELHFTTFLKYSLREPEWKLINRRVRRGMVELSRTELCRLLEEAVRRRIESELPLALPDEVKEAFGEPARRLRLEAEARFRSLRPKQMGKIRVDCFPPCFRHLLASAQSGENVPHSGRFALVAFLHALGVSPEEIMKSFAGSPDFQEDKTRYQVEHITGTTSGTEYTPPGCDTMKTYGICFEPDRLCAQDWMNHPLKYYRVKLRPGKEGGKGARGPGGKVEREQGPGGSEGRPGSD